MLACNYRTELDFVSDLANHHLKKFFKYLFFAFGTIGLLIFYVIILKNYETFHEKFTAMKREVQSFTMSSQSVLRKLNCSDYNDWTENAIHNYTLQLIEPSFEEILEIYPDIKAGGEYSPNYRIFSNITSSMNWQLF